MNIEITYNKDSDEFSDDISLTMRLQKYIKNHFYPAYTIAHLAPIYLIGGSIRDLICAKKPKDLDFVVLGKEHLEWILKIFKAYNIQFTLNRFGGYKFTFQDTEIDLWLTDDLFSSMQYNVDGLYYNLNNNQLLSLTFQDFQENGLKLINPENNIENGREIKLIKFQQNFLNRDS